MSMTYYAVTDDPNELAHYGILGMKWGVTRSPEQLGHPRHKGSHRQRSAAYKKAQSKLSKAMQNGIQKVETKWKVYNSPANKQIRAEKRYEKQTQRALAKARKGKLKYGKLTDDQIYRITDRLALERNARQLSETEKTWGKRLRESIGAGIISGVGQGAGRMASEAIARRSVLKTDRKRAEQQERMDKERQRRQFMQEMAFQEMRDRRASSQKVLQREAQKKVDQEYYEDQAKRGNLSSVRLLSSINSPSAKSRAMIVSANNSRKEAEELKKKQQEIQDRTYYQNYGKLLSDRDFNEKYPKIETQNNTGPGASQQPVSFWANGSYRYGVKRVTNTNKPKITSNKGNPDWYGDKRPPTPWGGPQTTPVPEPYETPGQYARRRRQEEARRRTGRYPGKS